MKNPIKTLGIIFIVLLAVFSIIFLGFGNNKKEDIVNSDSINTTGTISTADFAEFENNTSINNVIPPSKPKDNSIEFDDKAMQNVENGNLNNTNLIASNLVEPIQNEIKNEVDKTEQENQKNPFAEFEEPQEKITSNNSESKKNEYYKKATETKSEAINDNKPESMVEYVKEIQKDIKFRGYDNNFKYDNKEYRKGDIFLTWYEIEEITPNFIRFKDENYSYNLRFIDNERI